MERVKNVMQRLHDLYFARHQKSAIDVDLMLDYTRVMYADLLEWRKTFGEAPPTTEKADVNTEVTTSETPGTAKQEAQAGKPAAEPATAPAAAAPQLEATKVSAAPEAQPEPEPAAQTTQSPPADKPQDKVYQPMVRDEPAPKPAPEAETAPIIQTAPEKEPMNALQQEASGISFEPPSPPDVRNEVNEELLVEEPAVNPVVEEKPAPPPAEIPLPEPAQAAKPAATKPQGHLFHAEKAPRDIRSLIGINDKYLFLNELFSNHKSNYEETLDQLNLLSNAQQAEDWISTKVAQARKWDKEDATVESFYSVIRRHFSEM